MKTIFKLLLVLLAAVFFLPTLATILLSFFADGSIQISGYDDLFFDCFIDMSFKFLIMNLYDFI